MSLASVELLGFAAGVLELVTGLVTLVDQDAVFAVGNQAELDWGYVATAINRDAIRISYGLSMDDEDAALGQGVAREVDVGMQCTIDYALEGRAARVIWVHDAGSHVVLGRG